jgi:hypothetical protein
MSRQQREKAAQTADEVIEIILDEEKDESRESMGKLLKLAKECFFGLWRSLDGITEAIEHQTEEAGKR